MFSQHRKITRSQSTRAGLSERVANLRRNLNLAPAGLNAGAFQREHSAISPNTPARPTSLGDTRGPITIHWQDGPDAKVLIRNLGALAREDDIRHAAETVLAHITRFEQDDRPFPKEIYIGMSGKEAIGGLN